MDLYSLPLTNWCITKVSVLGTSSTTQIKKAGIPSDMLRILPLELFLPVASGILAAAVCVWDRAEMVYVLPRPQEGSPGQGYRFHRTLHQDV